MTLDAGRISTWRLPRFSALKMLRRQSLRTETRTIAAAHTRTDATRSDGRRAGGPQDPGAMHEAQGSRHTLLCF
jgi:hypothetical protein